MAPSAVDSFLSEAKKAEGRVELFLCTGKRISGLISEFDDTSITFHAKKGKANLVLRQGIVAFRTSQPCDSSDEENGSNGSKKEKKDKKEKSKDQQEKSKESKDAKDDQTK